MLVQAVLEYPLVVVPHAPAFWSVVEYLRRMGWTPPYRTELEDDEARLGSQHDTIKPLEQTVAREIHHWLGPWTCPRWSDHSFFGLYLFFLPLITTSPPYKREQPLSDDRCLMTANSSSSAQKSDGIDRLDAMMLVPLIGCHDS